MKDSLCQIAIAGLATTLVVPERLSPFVQHGFSGFLAADGIASLLNIQVNWEDTPILRGLANPPAYFENGVASFDLPGFTGWIDAVAGQAVLNVAAANPLLGIDYFLRVAYALLAFDAGGVMVHGAGIIRQGRAYLFFGHSGAGKTTVARLSSADQVLNDDLVLLRPEQSGWYVYGTPFSNPSQVLPTPGRAPLAGLFRLVQDQKVFLEPMRFAQAGAEILASCPVVSADPVRSTGLLKRGLSLIGEVPTYRLHFLPDPSFWPLVEQI